MSKTRTDTIEQADAERIAGQAEQAVAMADGERIARERFTDDLALLHQVIGRAQAMGAVRDFSQTVWVSQIAYIKESKLYRKLKGMKTPNGLEFSGTWEEFCREYLGCSDEKVNQDIANLNAFGEEALEAMQRMGLGYRDLRQFRRLPADERTALIEAARAGDKNELLDLAETLITKHDEEKKRLEEEKQEVEQRLQASERLLSDKDKKINELAVECERLKGSVKRPEDDPRIAQIREAAMRAQAALVDLHAMASQVAEDELHVAGELHARLEELRPLFALARETMLTRFPNLHLAMDDACTEPWHGQTVDMDKLQ